MKGVGDQCHRVREVANDELDQHEGGGEEEHSEEPRPGAAGITDTAGRKQLHTIRILTDIRYQCRQKLLANECDEPSCLYQC